jgi:serine/threonine protein kinase/WD40 repeat protein
MSENDARAKSVFLEAIAIESPDKLAGFLDTACGGDQALRARVEALLQAHREAGNSLGNESYLQADSDVSVSERGCTADCKSKPGMASQSTETPGSSFGVYKLLQLLGEGGMGAVWVAQQQKPVKRLVALKVIKQGHDSSQILRRFEAERQVLALMEHPNIARVLDAGATPQGAPYLVMELIKGIPITRFCDQERLTPRERLQLFVPVCSAVQHAHQKGVIHRDLKPSNVLIALYDGRPVPKVIDFGVAKAIAQKLTEGTMFTEVGQLVGTLEYMAPEQAELNNLDIDTRADIYSLGVILYELLTGGPPLTAEQLRAASFSEMLRLISEVEAPKPSTRLSSSENLPAIAANRKLEPGRLKRQVYGDLDWIVMKALAKDRGRRYETANGLARDLERFLADEPVSAGPPGTGYRLRKFARKNWQYLVTVAAFVLMLTTAALAGTWQAIRATLAETKARAAQTRAEEQFGVAQRSETKARQAEEAALADRQQAITNLYHARVEEAAAIRRARGMGYRARVFDRLQKALQLDTPDKDIDRLRQEAVACLGDFVGLEPIIWDDFSAGIKTIALTPDGDQMAIALDDGTIQLRDVRTGAQLAQLSESAMALGIDPVRRCLVSASAKGTIKAWREYGAGGALPLQTTEMNADFAGMSSNGRFAVGYTRREDGERFCLWDVARQEVMARLRASNAENEGPLRISANGKFMAQAYARDGKLYAHVWNTSVAEPKDIQFATTPQETAALAISQDGSLLACKHGDDGLILLDIATAQPRPLIREHELASACFSDDGRFLILYSTNHRIKLWSVSQHLEVATLEHPLRGRHSAAVFSEDGNSFATVSCISHSIRIWRLAGTGEKLILSGHAGGVACVAFSPDGKLLASGSKDCLLKLWDAGTGRLLRTLPRFPSAIQSVAFSPDGQSLVTGQFGPTSEPVQVRNLATLQVIAAPDGESARRAYGVAFSPDARILAACGDGLTLWRVQKNENAAADTPRYSFTRFAHFPGERSLHLCISPDSRSLAWVDHDNTIRLCDLANGRELPFPGPALFFGWQNHAFFPDSEHLTFGTADRMVESWDTRAARKTLTLSPNRSCVAASPDGKWFASGSDPFDVALWSSQTGSRVLAVPQECILVWSLALSPDGERLAIGLNDGGLAIWNLPKIHAQLEKIGLAWTVSR